MVFKPKNTKKNGKFVWFDDGKSNVAFNCLQKNISEMDQNAGI